MHHRVFAFKGKETDAKKKLKKILKNRKMSGSSSGGVIRFTAPATSPVYGYFKTTSEDNKVTHVEMIVSTAWWYYLLVLMFSLLLMVTGIAAYQYETLLGTLLVIVGMFEFGIGILSSSILQKKWDLYLSQQLHMNMFF